MCKWHSFDDQKDAHVVMQSVTSTGGGASSYMGGAKNAVIKRGEIFARGKRAYDTVGLGTVIVNNFKSFRCDYP
jgi:hypothetical protein